MGPMGPMMGGTWGGGIAMSMAIGFLVLLLVVVGGIVLAIARSRSPARRRPPTPAELLAERHTRGELTTQQYRQALVDLLKGRYVGGEIGLEEYEAQLERLLVDLGRARDRARGLASESGGANASEIR